MQNEPLEVTLKVTKAFEQLGIPYLIGGSLASTLYGMVRTTQDSDIIVEYQNLLNEKEILNKQLKGEQRKQKELKSQLAEYEHNVRIQNFGFRIFYILLSVLITWLFFQTKLITDAKLLFLLPIVLFFLLVFPIERIRSISARHSSTEAQVDLDGKAEKKSR